MKLRKSDANTDAEMAAYREGVYAMRKKTTRRKDNGRRTADALSPSFGLFEGAIVVVWLLIVGLFTLWK